MKKIILILSFCVIAINIHAQKFAYINTDYILNKIPEYKQAQDKIDNFSNDWQKELENKYTNIEEMYRSYQKDKVLLSEKMKEKREEAIINKENEIKSLEAKYFGPDGLLYKKRQELIKPIQDKIWDATQQFATNNKYQIIFDSSSDLIMIYHNDNLDKSDKVLEILGY